MGGGEGGGGIKGGRTRSHRGIPSPSHPMHIFVILLEVIICRYTGSVHVLTSMAGKGGGVALFFFNLQCLALYLLIYGYLAWRQHTE